MILMKGCQTEGEIQILLFLFRTIICLLDLVDGRCHQANENVSDVLTFRVSKQVCKIILTRPLLMTSFS